MAPLIDIFAKELGITRGRNLKNLVQKEKLPLVIQIIIKETDNINKQFQNIAQH
jgi:hypothetical protein